MTILQSKYLTNI